MAMKRARSGSLPSSLSEDLQGRCSRIAREIHEQGEVVRNDKILTARVRICSGYYDSEDVLRTIAERLLSEGQTLPPSS